MTARDYKILAGIALIVMIAAAALRQSSDARWRCPADRSEVVFWHFWGGKDRPVVEAIVDRFNASQSTYFVRPIAMPGNNLDLKFFLSVAGHRPPDLLNQDDPIVADWAERGALVPLDELASPAEAAALPDWLFPAARQIGTHRGRLYALCNGLDIRALYYNADLLDEYGLAPPRTIDELDAAAVKIAPVDGTADRQRYGFLPDPRRIWSWGIVFGGRFFDPATDTVTADSEPIVRALDWMASYSRRYGPASVARFRKGDQALPGAAFPLFEGRYAMIVDGQWRVAEIAAVAADAERRGQHATRYGVVPLPHPAGGTANAGWVNGNFFVVPRGAANARGAWEFMKFWSGFGGHEADAARACAAGGWIPASRQVVDHPEFQALLARQPLFKTFVDLAASPDQVPTPAIVGAQFFQDEMIRAAENALYKNVEPRAALENAAQRVRAQRERERE